MPLFNYKELPSNTIKNIVAPSVSVAENDVGTPDVDFDADYGFVDISPDEAGELLINANFSTGTYSGLELTQDSSTEVLIGAGTGNIIDYSDPDNPILFTVVWSDDTTPITATTLGTDGESVVTLSRDRTIEFTLLENVTDAFYRDNIKIGTMIHSGGVIDRVAFIPQLAREPYHQFVDLMEALGIFNMNGFDITPSVDGFSTASGQLMKIGSGAANNERLENVIDIFAQNATSFQEFLGITNTITEASTSNMNVTQYDDGSGTLVDIPGTNRAVIKYMFLFATNNLPNIAIMHGQTVYQNIDDAIINVDADFGLVQGNIPAFYADNSLLLGRIVVKDGGDLSDIDEAAFLPGALFGTRLNSSTGTGGGGGGDFFGPASSVIDEMVTFADATGKVGKSGSDITAGAGDIKRVTNNTDLLLSRRGTGKVILGHTPPPVSSTSNAVIAHKNSGGHGFLVSVNSDNSTWVEFANQDETQGSVGNNNGRQAIGLYNGDDVTAPVYFEIRQNDTAVCTAKAGFGSTSTPQGVVQANSKADDTSQFFKDIGCPLVGNQLIDNGGDIPAEPEPALVLMRSGVSAESYGNIARFDLSRYEVSGTDARTRLDFKLSHGQGSSEGNDTPLIFTLLSNGTAVLNSEDDVNLVLNSNSVEAAKLTLSNTGGGSGLTHTSTGDTILSNSNALTEISLNSDTTIDVGNFIFAGTNLINSISGANFETRITGTGGEFIMQAPEDSVLVLNSSADTIAGVNFKTFGTVKGGVGFRDNQVVLKPYNFDVLDDTRGVIVDVIGNQTRVEGIKHYDDNARNEDVIESTSGVNLLLRGGSSAALRLGKTTQVAPEGSSGDGAVSIGSISTDDDNLSLSLDHPGRVSRMNRVTEAQRDAATSGVLATDIGKFCFNTTATKFQVHDGTSWVNLN